MHRLAALALALACVGPGCSKRAPSGFAPALGPGDGEATTMVLTTGIGPTGGASESGDAAASEASDASGQPDEAGSSGEPPMSTTSSSTTEPVADASSSTSGSPVLPGDPLDPSLDIPEEGEACDTPGSLGECPGIAVCRFATSEQGLCESCEPCGNLGDPCSASVECDILFACYDGRCTNFCELGTPGCGPIEDCLDVGHPTHGVCDPSAI
jgi:hypothetical protein